MDSFEKYASSEHLKSTLVERLEKVAVRDRVERPKKGRRPNVSSTPPQRVRAQVGRARARKAARKAAEEKAARLKILNRLTENAKAGTGPAPGMGETDVFRLLERANASDRLKRLKMGGKVLGGLAVTGAGAAAIAKLLKSRQAAKKALPEMTKAQKLVEMIKRNPKKSMAAGAAGVSGLGAGLAALAANKKR